MKTTVVVMTADGPRVYINPLKEFLQGKEFIINPNMDRVENLSPHQWDFLEGALVPADPAVAEKRRATLHTPQPPHKKRLPWLLPVVLSLINLAVSALIWEGLHK